MASTTTAASAGEATEPSASTTPTPTTVAKSAAAASPTSSSSSSSSPSSPSSSPSSPSSSPPYFEVIGRLQGKSAPPNPPLSSPPPPEAVFAVVDFGGTQHKACPGDVLFADGWLDGRVDINDVVRFTRVLAVGSASRTRIGRPALSGVSVTAAVEELVLDAKQLHFVKRRRKASRRLKGHRQPLTALRVLSVEGAGV